MQFRLECKKTNVCNTDGGKMYKIEELKVFVNERLHTVASEILGVMEKTITDYEEQASRLKRESDRQRTLLDIVLRPKLPQREATPAATPTAAALTADAPTANGPATDTTTAITATTATTATTPLPLGACLVLRASGSPNELQCVFTSRTDFLKFAANGNCPYCFKRTLATETHLIKKHYLFAIHYTENGTENFIVPCTCKDRIKGRSHWHCPKCRKIIYRKSNFEGHLSKQHGYLIQQQNQDTEIHQPSVCTCEEVAPLTPWCKQEFGCLDQEDQQPSLPHHIKEEQEELWISQEGKQSPVVHLERQCPERQQIKEEQKQPYNGQVREQPQGLEEDDAEKSVFTITSVESLNHDSTLAMHLSQINRVESSERDPRPTSSYEPMEGQPDRGACQARDPTSGYWHPTENCAVAENGNSGRNEDWRKSSGPRSSSKSLKAKTVKRYCSRISMKRKKSTWLSASQSPTGPHCCKACGKSFHYMYTLRTHAQTHTVDALHICGLCGKHFGSRESLVQHLQTHVERNKCHICGKCFSSNSFLKLHRRFHRGKDLGVISSGDKKRF